MANQTPEEVKDGALQISEFPGSGDAAEGVPVVSPKKQSLSDIFTIVSNSPFQ